VLIVHQDGTGLLRIIEDLLLLDDGSNERVPRAIQYSRAQLLNSVESPPKLTTACLSRRSIPPANSCLTRKSIS
jgi:hypothetical protein